MCKMYISKLEFEKLNLKCNIYYNIQMKIRLKVSKKNEEIYDSSHILENNHYILSELDKYQEEINYKISDNVEYLKKVQRTLLDQSLFNQIGIQKKSIFPIQLKKHLIELRKLLEK